MKDKDFTFEGFEQSNTTPVPDVLFDRLLSRLTGAELKCLLYIIRRTRGFKKDTDAISLTQFEKGIITKDGKILDEGCGVKDRKTIIAALASLERMNLILSEKSLTDLGDNATTLYRISFKGVVGKSHHPGGGEIPPRVVGKTTLPGSGKKQLPVVGKSHPQETDLQETDLQETDLQEESATSSQPEHSGTDVPTPPSSSHENNEENKSSRETSKSQQESLLEEVPPTMNQPEGKTPRNGSKVAKQEVPSQQGEKPAKTRQKKVVVAGELDIRAKLQEWIDKERGYKLYGRAPKEQIFQERNAVETLAHMVYLYEAESNQEDGCSRDELAYVRAHIRKYDPYWSKEENKNRIGAYAILQKCAELIAVRRNQQHPKTDAATATTDNITSFKEQRNKERQQALLAAAAKKRAEAEAQRRQA